MSRVIDETGNRYGKLVILERAGSKDGKAAWRCLCDCGNETIVTGKHLRGGHTRSCSCLQGRRFKGSHWKTETRVYNSWRAMLERCNNPNCISYPNYGGRGIQVCTRWHDFEEFYADMGDPPSDEYWLDRTDNEGDYEPTNCRWSTVKRQCRNKRNNRLIEYDGRIQCIAAWAEELDIDYTTLFCRFKAGWSTERALTEPVRPLRRFK